MMGIKFGKTAEKPPQNPVSPEKKIDQDLEKNQREKLQEARKTVIEEINRTENMAPATIGPVTGIIAPSIKRQKQIESILASGLDEIYLHLTPEKQKKLKQAGEETANQINKLLAKTKINLSAIVKLIKKWLALIPGINRYFLEQEAKIKADEIIKIKR